MSPNENKTRLQNAASIFVDGHAIQSSAYFSLENIKFSFRNYKLNTFRNLILFTYETI